MAQPNLEYFIRRALLLKLEVTEGVDSAPVPGTDAFEIFDGKSSIEFDKVERKKDRPYFNNDQFMAINPYAMIEGGMELACPTAPGQAVTGIPGYDGMLQIAGMARTLDAVGKTTTYNPITSNIKSATAWWYHSATLRKALGSRASISGLSLAVGSWFKAQTRIQGTCSDVLEAALPGGLVYTAFPDPVVATSANTTLLVGPTGGAPTLHTWGKELSVDFGSELKTKEFTEKKINSISGRKATWKMRMARTAKADFDPWALMLAGTLIVAEFTHNVTATKSSTLGIRGQIEKVDEVEVDGDYCFELSGRCIASDTGGDEFFIKHKEV